MVELPEMPILNKQETANVTSVQFSDEAWEDVLKSLEAQRDLDAINWLKWFVEWGDEPCIDHTEIQWPDALGGGTVTRQKLKHRRCQHCWQELKDKLAEIIALSPAKEE